MNPEHRIETHMPTADRLARSSAHRHLHEGGYVPRYIENVSEIRDVTDDLVGKYVMALVRKGVHDTRREYDAAEEASRLAGNLLDQLNCLPLQRKEIDQRVLTEAERFRGLAEEAVGKMKNPKPMNYDTYNSAQRLVSAYKELCELEDSARTNA